MPPPPPLPPHATPLLLPRWLGRRRPLHPPPPLSRFHTTLPDLCHKSPALYRHSIVSLPSPSPSGPESPANASEALKDILERQSHPQPPSHRQGVKVANDGSGEDDGDAKGVERRKWYPSKPDPYAGWVRWMVLIQHCWIKIVRYISKNLHAFALHGRLPSLCLIPAYHNPSRSPSVLPKPPIGPTRRLPRLYRLTRDRMEMGRKRTKGKSLMWIKCMRG